MAATSGVVKCKYCRSLANASETVKRPHRSGCPRTSTLVNAEKLWSAGYDKGFYSDHEPTEHVKLSLAERNTGSYLLGVQIGEYDIEVQVENAIASNYGEELDPDEYEEVEKY